VQCNSGAADHAGEDGRVLVGDGGRNSVIVRRGRGLAGFQGVQEVEVGFEEGDVGV